MAYMISSASDRSNKSGTSSSPEYGVEAAVGQEHVVNQTFVSRVVGFRYGEQRTQNRGKRGFRTSQPDRTQHRSSLHLQRRYTKWFSRPVTAALIGVLVVLLVFGFYSASTRSIASTGSLSCRSSHGHAEAVAHSSQDGGFQSRLPRFVKNDPQSRVARAGEVFEQKVGEQESGDADNAQLQPPVDARNSNDPCKGLLDCGSASLELVRERRMLLQAQSQSKEEIFVNNSGAEELRIIHSNGKDLRGYAEFGAQLTKKKRMRKQREKDAQNRKDAQLNREAEIREEARVRKQKATLILSLCMQFPLVAFFLLRQPFFFIWLYFFGTDVMIFKFFIITYKLIICLSVVDVMFAHG